MDVGPAGQVNRAEGIEVDGPRVGGVVQDDFTDIGRLLIIEPDEPP